MLKSARSIENTHKIIEYFMIKINKNWEEKQMSFKVVKEKKGITLIALVITIIVLLILAGVTIASLTGENGILTQTTKAKEESEKAEIIEQIQLDIADVLNCCEAAI